MEHFSVQELTSSKTAQARGINNTPSAQQRQNIEALINNVLDTIRTAWGAPIHVNSGFRCSALNKAVGGANKSHHLKGMAADITAGDATSNKRLFDLIIDLMANNAIRVTQLINENNFTWIHVSYRADDLRNQVLAL